MKARLVSAGIAVGLGAVLVLAALLEPAVDGHGTHTQLGLGTCTFLTATGYPCPMCGATTTFALLAHLRVVDGLVNQPFAALLFVLATGAFSIAVAELVDPRRRWEQLGGWLGPNEAAVALAFLVLMGLGWAYKAVLMSVPVG